MELTGILRANRMLLVLGVTAGSVAFAANPGPRLAGTFDMNATRTTPSGVSLDFALTIENRGDDEVTVDQIVLLKVFGSEQPYATLDGGTPPPGGTLRRSAAVSVAPSVFERWQSSGLASIVVHTRNAREEVRHTKIVVYRYSGR